VPGDPAFHHNPRPSHPRRPPGRAIFLDRSLEALPLFRLSDSAEETTILYTPPAGGRWRVLPAPGDRLPGTFDQDVYVEICRRYMDAGSPADGAVSFTLHAFLRSIGRRADGHAHRSVPLSRLERTVLVLQRLLVGDRQCPRRTILRLSAVSIDRRRTFASSLPSFRPSPPPSRACAWSLFLRANIAQATPTISQPLSGLSSQHDGSTALLEVAGRLTP
jgi:hypothetical protein